MWRLLKIKSLTTIFKVAGYFSAEYSLEEHTQKKLELKLERSLAPFSFKFTISNDANAPVLVEVFHLNSTALDQVESIAGDHLIIFRILDFECYHSQQFLVILFLRLFILCKFSCQSGSLYTEDDRVQSSMFDFALQAPVTIFPLKVLLKQNFRI